MALYSWSTTAADNATADASINWAEGQAPSSVNDSARAMMAAIATARRDTQGVSVSAGTTSALTLTSNQVFSSLAAMDGQMIVFVAGTGNLANATLNVDGLGAKPLVSAPATGTIPEGVLVAGTPYAVTYYNGVAQFRLWSFFADPFNIPLGGAMMYFGTTAPNSNFVFPYGQAISRTTYATLFTLFGTTYGVGDGSTTFNIPDLRGRVPAGKDDMGGTSANRLTDANDGLNGDTLGDTGGGETQVLVTANLPAYTPAGSISVQSTQDIIPSNVNPLSSDGGSGGGLSIPYLGNTGKITSTGTLTGTAQGGTSTAFGIVQPTIICNYILRIL